MKDDREYLLHIMEAIARIAQYTSGGEESFLDDPKTQDAVVRNLEIIGEAVEQLNESFRTARQEVPWKQIAGMRDKLIHEYFGVNLRLVWEVVSQSLPALRRSIAGAL